ncbi:UDP-N-acetylmuramate dehydrogenase [Candidatus Nanosynbacter sp. TM7-087]|uniref:UDP-N-acetylmuramate dehydrogenase n=1 Tax=Candidatus Nanosynbacter sp. TM7-087 TaxID=2902631 RepID=UPI001FB72849|nr:UDP-N-acetylmuramate dehydrogenase [Candidatus Nanosynbacter sp. TM7-087]MCJ1966519.1 UDP-N-acetylmuramate dehydrogenase [Candidatus Nanosynbacter sp. TM7-087]
MDVMTNISLKQYTTMKLGGEARYMATADSASDVVSLYRNARKENLPIFVLGGGSNVITHDEVFEGIVLLNRIKGFEIISEADETTDVKIGAGEVWDEVVERVIGLGLQGIEAMSGIPGTAGAAPVQNVGAYGQEIADTLISLEAYDSKTDTIVTISADECDFSYRNSIFRDKEKGRYCILNITLRLNKAEPKPPYYASLQKYIDENDIREVNLSVIRVAVLNIRSEKLPDPAELPSAGSFFKNALVEKWKLEELQKEYSDIPNYAMSDGRYKIPTGWLIDKAGLRGYRSHGMRVYEKNALVLVNDSATGYDDLAAIREEIVQIVFDKFGIKIEQEPLELSRQ